MTTALRALGICLLACSLLLATAGSVGYDAGVSDRSASIGLVEDTEAQVGVDTDECRVSNNAHLPLTILVTTEDGQVEQFEAVEPGEARSVSVNGTARIRALGADVQADLVREFDCEDGGEADDDSDGGENADGDDSKDDGSS